MGYINVFLSSPCSLSIKNKQLVVQGKEVVSFPLEDVNSVMVENSQSNISAYVLQKMAEYGVATFFCDDKHLPNGILLPFNGYYRQSKTQNEQFEAPKALKKQLWQKIVICKIRNQAECIRLTSGEICDELLAIAKNVLSDDRSNQEAVAAQLYFKTLFGKKFSRKEDVFVNACLNYGYAIVRGLVARTLAASGFNTNYGIHHKNQFNAFNLADDIFEPYRPCVDVVVKDLIESGYDDFLPEVKRKLFSVVNMDVMIDDEVQSLSYSVKLTVESLSKSFQNKSPMLKMPTLIEFNHHKYE